MSDAESADTQQAKTEDSTPTIAIDELGLTVAAASQGQDVGPKAFLFVWFKLFRTAQIHVIGNQALQGPIQSFIEVTKHLLATDGAASLQAKDGTVFVNSAKLSLSSEEYNDTAEPVFDFLKERGMGGIVVEGSLDEQQVHELLRLMVYSSPNGRTFETLASQLRSTGLPLRINKPLGVKKGKGHSEAVLERRSYTFLTYSKLVVLCRGLLTEENITPAKRHYLVKKVARAIEALVDICLEDDHTFLGISSVKSQDAYAVHHAANTAVLAIALGEKLGMSKVDLADLGMSSALCDIGFRELPVSQLRNEDDLNADDREVFEQHTVLGVKFFLAEPNYTKSVLRRIVVAHEHHRHVDGGGYPRSNKRMNLFARIVAIAETYDALTTNRPGSTALLPDEALGHMLAQSGKRFDPLLLKIFVNTMGLYPVGTFVRLSTGEAGVVVYGGGEGERLSRPMVALLDSRGKPSQTVDLTEQDASGNYVRNIVASEDPAQYGLRSSGVFFESQPA